MSDNKDLDSIKIEGDLGTEFFYAKADAIGYKGEFNFFINGILTRGVCSVNTKDKTYVLEVISLDDGMWYERRGFIHCVVFGNSKTEDGVNIIAGGHKFLESTA